MNLPDFLSQDAEGHVHLAGHRIGLSDVVRLYSEGYSPEMLVGNFPSLPLSLIHRVLAFYLDNRKEVDAYVAKELGDCEQHRPPGDSALTLQPFRRTFPQIQPPYHALL